MTDRVAYVATIEYQQTYSDAAVYVRKTANGDITILPIHVDNVLSFGNTSTGLKIAQDQLHKTFALQ